MPLLDLLQVLQQLLLPPPPQLLQQPLLLQRPSHLPLDQLAVVAHLHLFNLHQQLPRHQHQRKTSQTHETPCQKRAQSPTCSTMPSKKQSSISKSSPAKSPSQPTPPRATPRNGRAADAIRAHLEITKAGRGDTTALQALCMDGWYQSLEDGDADGRRGER